MHINNSRARIFDTFTEDVFQLPLFYKYPNSLRFDLSDEDDAIGQFLVAMDKARSLFKELIGNDGYVVCLRFRFYGSIYELRENFKALRSAGVSMHPGRDFWCEDILDADLQGSDGAGKWLYVAFDGIASQIDNLLWCALSQDLGEIRPSPKVMVYFFNFHKNISILPYDARGMDVAGVDKAYLKHLFIKYRQYLFDYDMSEMSSRSLGWVE